MDQTATSYDELELSSGFRLVASSAVVASLHATNVVGVPAIIVIIDH